ncbi:MAG TPA: Ku protein [Actinomycetota bacterium]|nr:Ku protein [Actinomycetota bacterium]
MARAVWTGSISFGLVSIPVRLYPATSPRDPRFHLVDRTTGRRVRYRRVVEEPPPAEEEEFGEDADDESPRVEESSPAPESSRPASPAPEPPTEREVSYEEMARGYDVGEGRHVVVEQEELEALRPEPSRTIEIEHFVSLVEVDPVHFEKSYHLAPAEEVGEKPYALLRLAMERTGRVAVGRFVLRSREHLVLIRPTLGILGLETLYFEDEVRRPEERWIQSIQIIEEKVSGAEVQMAERLVEALAVEWDPSRYRDDYRERVLDLIGSRTPAEEPASVEPSGASVTDLMAALKASVEAATKPAKRGKRAGGAGGR